MRPNILCKGFWHSVQICDFLGEPVWLASMWLTRENFRNWFLLFVCSCLIGTIEETKVVYFLNYFQSFSEKQVKRPYSSLTTLASFFMITMSTITNFERLFFLPSLAFIDRHYVLTGIKSENLNLSAGRASRVAGKNICFNLSTFNSFEMA